MAHTDNPYASPAGLAKHKYLTAPVASPDMPRGIPYIIANEAAERFSFYGMRGILTIFMTKYLLDSSGALAPMSPEEATAHYHEFVAAAYLFPVLGAFLSDAVLGKYRTILLLSVVYCFGHLALALDETRLGLALGLTLIALGSGGIKPCVSAHVGDQFGNTNKHLMSKVFSWFYFSINLGSFISSILTPILLDEYGPSVAFGVPGVLMAMATIFFWMGRNKFVHIPPAGWSSLRDNLKGEGLRVIGRLATIYIFVALFWTLFDQHGSSWVLQADRMDREIFGYTILPSQVQAANPLLIMLLIPAFTYGIYPAMNSVFTLTPLRKIGIGLFIAALSFVVVALIEHAIEAGSNPNVAWQFIAYILITSAEVMVSITCLEFSYTQAPPKMKSIIMAEYFLSISLGNEFAAVVNHLMESGTLVLSGPGYFWFFSGAMLLNAVLFTIVSTFYKERTYVQEEQPAH